MELLLLTQIKLNFLVIKIQTKKYYKHTGHPGGIKEITPDKLKEKNKSEDIIKKAIKGMLPNSPLFRDLMKNNLKLYKDSNHPHESQNPKPIDFKSQNRKNLINV
jgi:large subunit ribosomal protein L13